MFSFESIPRVKIYFFDELEDLLLESSAKDSCYKYGLELEVLNREEELFFIAPIKGVLQHAVIRLKRKWDPSFCYKFLETYQERMSVTVVFCYTNINESLMFADEIEAFKKLQRRNSINIMRPDLEINEGWSSSRRKILDNFVCDTRKVKYTPERMGGLKESLYYDEINIIREYSVFFRNYVMWHRAPSDGYFAVRVDEGFLITSTGQDKSNIVSPDQISLVTSYCVKENKVSYYGKNLPSSDSVEAAILFGDHLDISSIFHSHDSNRFTRNEAALLAHKSIIQFLPYGEVELGRSLSNVFSQNSETLLIMKEHGEIFLGLNGNSCINEIDVWASSYCR